MYYLFKDINCDKITVQTCQNRMLSDDLLSEGKKKDSLLHCIQKILLSTQYLF